jgi:hypothetical protein
MGPSGPQGPSGPKGATGPDGPGVKTIAGFVSSIGGIQEGSGFSVTYNGAGDYTVTFPNGTWSGGCIFPVMTVTPIAGVAVTVRHSNLVCTFAGGGSIGVVIETAGSSPAATDSAFQFIAAQP